MNEEERVLAEHLRELKSVENWADRCGNLDSLPRMLLSSEWFLRSIQRLPIEFEDGPLAFPPEVCVRNLSPSNTSTFYMTQLDGTKALCYLTRHINYEITRDLITGRPIGRTLMSGVLNKKYESYFTMYFPGPRGRMIWRPVCLDLSEVDFTWDAQKIPPTLARANAENTRIHCVEDMRLYEVDGVLEGYGNVCLNPVKSLQIFYDSVVGFFVMDMSDRDKPVARFKRIIKGSMSREKNHVVIIGRGLAFNTYGRYGKSIEYYRYNSSNSTHMDISHLLPRDKLPALMATLSGSTPAYGWPTSGTPTEYWALTHTRFNKVPGKKRMTLYHHVFVVLDANYPHAPVAYSLPFTFAEITTEFTIGFVFKDDAIVVVATKMDWYPTQYTIPMAWVRERLIRVTSCE